MRLNRIESNRIHRSSVRVHVHIPCSIFHVQCSMCDAVIIIYLSVSWFITDFWWLLLKWSSQISSAMEWKTNMWTFCSQSLSNTRTDTDTNTCTGTNVICTLSTVLFGRWQHNPIHPMHPSIQYDLISLLLLLLWHQRRRCKCRPRLYSNHAGVFLRKHITSWLTDTR